MSRARTAALQLAALLAAAPLGAQTSENFGFVLSFPTGARTPFTTTQFIQSQLNSQVVFPVDLAFTSPDDPTGFFEGAYGGWSTVLRDANGFPGRLSVALSMNTVQPFLMQLTGACAVVGADDPARFSLQGFWNNTLVGTARYDGSGNLLSSLPPATLGEPCIGTAAPPLRTPLTFNRLEISSTAPDFFVPIIFVQGRFVATPEPATVTLVASGVLLLGVAASRRRRL